jgi:protein-S-isoprenylcysteine O-methyltransferase Ste14
VPLFTTNFETILFGLIILIWILSEIITGGIIPKVRRRGENIKNEDRGSSLLLRLSLFFSVFSAILLAENDIAMLPDTLFYPGIFLMFIGILVRQWAIFILGCFFTLTISVQKDQNVIDYGPYRFIRHPSYLGLFLTAIGIGIALESWVGILVILLLFGLAIGYRIHIEERFLIAELGDDYTRYMKRTKRLIPYIV